MQLRPDSHYELEMSSLPKLDDLRFLCARILCVL